MARVDPKRKAVHAKLVYYGPGLCGKTTNLEVINKKVATGDLMSLATEGGTDFSVFLNGATAIRGLPYPPIAGISATLADPIPANSSSA